MKDDVQDFDAGLIVEILSCVEIDDKTLQYDMFLHGLFKQKAENKIAKFPNNEAVPVALGKVNVYFDEAKTQEAIEKNIDDFFSDFAYSVSDLEVSEFDDMDCYRAKVILKPIIELEANTKK